MGIKDKIKVVEKVSVSFSQTQKRDFAYKATLESREDLKKYFEGELGTDNEASVRACVRVAEETKTLLGPVVGLAIRTNPNNKEKYAKKGKRKEELMAEILSIISEESKARADAAAKSRKENKGAAVVQ
jgi:hypothetical protein